MAARSKGDIDRWLMKQQQQQQQQQKNKSTSPAASPSAPASPQRANMRHSKSRLFERLGAEIQSRQLEELRQAQQAHQTMRDSHEDLDFDEVFDDDDEGFHVDADDDPSGPNVPGNPNNPSHLSNSPLKKSTYKLSTEGLQMKRIVRQLDKNNDIIYASDDEMDPYASDDDEAASPVVSEGQHEHAHAPSPASFHAPSGSATSRPTVSKQPTQPSNDEGNFDKLVDSVVTASNKSRSTTPAASRATSPSGSPQKAAAAAAVGSVAKRAKQEAPVSPAAAQDDVITEAMLVSFLRQGPLSTKDLIAKFKRQLKADPKNKDIFRELVRRVAMVKPVGSGQSGEEDRLLELKPEYK